MRISTEFSELCVFLNSFSRIIFIIPQKRFGRFLLKKEGLNLPKSVLLNIFKKYKENIDKIHKMRYNS